MFDIDIEKLEMMLHFWMIFLPPIATFSVMRIYNTGVSTKKIIAVGITFAIIWLALAAGWMMI